MIFRSLPLFAPMGQIIPPLSSHACRQDWSSRFFSRLLIPFGDFVAEGAVDGVRDLFIACCGGVDAVGAHDFRGIIAVVDRLFLAGHVVIRVKLAGDVHIFHKIRVLLQRAQPLQPGIVVHGGDQHAVAVAHAAVRAVARSQTAPLAGDLQPHHPHGCVGILAVQHIQQLSGVGKMAALQIDIGIGGCTLVIPRQHNAQHINAVDAVFPAIGLEADGAGLFVIEGAVFPQIAGPRPAAGTFIADGGAADRRSPGAHKMDVLQTAAGGTAIARRQAAVRLSRPDAVGRQAVSDAKDIDVLFRGNRLPDDQPTNKKSREK